MDPINVYTQYFEGEAVYNDVPRHGVAVWLIASSEGGVIRYEVALSFFPHNDEEDFAISYDAYLSKVIYEAPGRRSKKKEETFMESLREEADLLASTIGGTIFWDSPLIEARRA